LTDTRDHKLPAYSVVYDYSDAPTLKQFALSNARIRLIIGPFGCLRGDVKILTEQGPVRIADIIHPVRVLSWNEKNQKFQLSQASSAFPKGKDCLYRVSTLHGEFVAKDSHRILSYRGIYLRVDQLKVGDEIASIEPNLLSTISSSFQSEKPLGVHRSFRKDVDYPESYVNEDHQCGQRLHLEEDNVQVFSPLQDDVLQHNRSLGDLDNHTGQEPLRNHSEGYDDLHGKTGYACQSFSLSDRLVDSFANCNGSLNDKPYFGVVQIDKQFPDTSSCHHNNQLSDSYKTSSDLSLSRILSIERLNVKEEYWDMHVFGTNNYVTADGTIHHNSGKSSACVMEIIRKGHEQAPSSDGIRRSRWAVVRNTFSQLKDTTIKTFLDWFPDKVFGNYRITDHSYMITAFPGVQIEVLFRALDRPDQVSNLLSLELTGAWFNEAREIPKAIIEAMDGRIDRYPAVKDGGCTWTGIIMDTNPPDDDSYLYKMFEVVRPEGWEVFKQPSGLSAQAENTKHLSKNYYTNLARGKDEMYVRVYIHGQYGFMVSGKPVFTNYNDSVHCAKRILEPVKGLPLVIGLDFGLQPACTIGQVTPFGQLRILDELVSDGMAIKQFAINQILPLLRTKYWGYDIVGYGDPAGSARSQTDESTCFDVLHSAEIGLQNVISAPTNSIVARVSAVDNFLCKMVNGEPGLLLSPNCRYLRKAFNGDYHYALEKSFRGGQQEAKDMPVKNFSSHIMDSCEYLCLYIDEKQEYDKQKKALLSRLNQRAHHPASRIGGY